MKCGTMSKNYSYVAEVPGVRLDRFSSENCVELSRTKAQKLIEDGLITVNNRVVRASYRLESGDTVTVNIPDEPSGKLIAEKIPLNILYEDEDLIVVDKPSGLTVHPAPGHQEHTLVNAILAHYPHLADIGDDLRPGIVHRLDKDTSGLMLVAKNEPAQMNLINQFKSHAVVKTYQALVKGHLSPEQGSIESDIGRDTRNRKKMAVVSEGKEARTQYKVIRYIKDFSLLEIILETGRTHQIRVHLAAIGYPVVGDSVYGVKSKYLSRQFLHSCRLGFVLPSSGENVVFTSELPPDLQKALQDIA